METPSGWEIKNGKLTREWSFDDFNEAWVFLDTVAGIARRQNHHPEIWNAYNKVRLTLCTHDAGDAVTEKDIALAQAINDR